MLARSLRGLTFAGALCVGAVAAQGAPKIHTAKLAPNSPDISVGSTIWLQFETPVALTDCDVVFPSPAKPACQSPLQQTPWQISVFDKSDNEIHPAVKASSDILGNLPSNGFVRLDLDQRIADGYSRIVVTFSKGSAPQFTIEGANPKGTKLVGPSKTKDDSNLYISGTFAPAGGSSPSYTIDSKANFILHSFDYGAYTIGATGDINTDKKTTADPDSFHWAIPVQHTEPFRKISVTEQFSTIGMELDKKGNAMNLVSAPSATGSVSHTFTSPDEKNPGAKKVTASIGLDISAGLEFGDNFKNDYAVANKVLGGQGWFLRGVPSTTVYLIIPKACFLGKVTLTSSYTARIPTTNEVFIENRNTAKPKPELTSNTRNFVQNTINFSLTSYVAIQIKHQYGALPPAFNLVRNSGSIGLVFALKELHGNTKSATPN